MTDHDLDSMRETRTVLAALARKLGCDPTYPSIAQALETRRRSRGEEPGERYIAPRPQQRIRLEPYRGDLLVTPPLNVIALPLKRGGQHGSTLPARKARTLAIYRLLSLHAEEFEQLHRQARAEYGLDPNQTASKTVRRTARILEVDLPR